MCFRECVAGRRNKLGKKIFLPIFEYFNCFYRIETRILCFKYFISFYYKFLRFICSLVTFTDVKKIIEFLSNYHYRWINSIYQKEECEIRNSKRSRSNYFTQRLKVRTPSSFVFLSVHLQYEDFQTLENASKSEKIISEYWRDLIPEEDIFIPSAFPSQQLEMRREIVSSFKAPLPTLFPFPFTRRRRNKRSSRLQAVNKFDTAVRGFLWSVGEHMGEAFPSARAFLLLAEEEESICAVCRVEMQRENIHDDNNGASATWVTVIKPAWTRLQNTSPRGGPLKVSRKRVKTRVSSSCSTGEEDRCNLRAKSQRES